jgi:glycerophosphoryl diester phosphodiesterase
MGSTGTPVKTSTHPVAMARTSRAWRVASTILALVMAAMAVPAATPSPAERLLALERPLVIAHRGYSAFAPENTRVAFDLAVAAGADLVELDYYHTSDGIPVVIHDSTLDRTTDARARWGGKDLPVAARTMAELRELDAGQWFKPPVTGQRLLTLDEALGIIQARGVTLIERKQGDAATLARLLQERDLVNQVVVQAFDWKFLREFHQVIPQQVMGALGPPGSRNGRRLEDHEKALNRGWLEEIRGMGAQMVVWNRQVDRESVSLAHQMGLRVWIYTINDAPLASSLLATGVDGIITDNPAIIWKVMATLKSP